MNIKKRSLFPSDLFFDIDGFILKSKSICDIGIEI